MPLGQAAAGARGRRHDGDLLGAMLRPALEAVAEVKQKDGVECRRLDLLTLSPLDDELLAASARKTGRVVIVHEAPRSFGPGAEVVARLVEKSFFHLEAPVVRVTGYDVVIPLFSREKHYLPGAPRILQAARTVLSA